MQQFPQVGDAVGEYRLERLLGRGAMGVVYAARDPRLGRDVAIKLLLDGVSPEQLLRFEEEGRTVARLEHPQVVRLLHAGRHGNLPYLVMEWIQGEDLAVRLRRGKPPLREALELMVLIARAVAHCHAQGVTHRDLKPANVLLDETGQPKLVDFGIARRVDRETLTQSGAMLGTLLYMAPEQIFGRPEAASDVYALGAILYELLTGEPPFRAPTALALAEKVTSEQAPPPSRRCPELPPVCDRICARLLAHEPGERPTAGELATALAELLHQLDAPPRRTRLTPLALVPAALALGAGLAGAWLWTRGPMPPPPPPPPPATSPAPLDSATTPDRTPTTLPIPPRPGEPYPISPNRIYPASRVEETELRTMSAAYQGTTLVLPGADLAPTLLHERQPSQRFRMWWLGVDAAQPEDAPGRTRLLYSESPAGRVWSYPRIVLEAPAGAGRDDPADHGLGAGSILAWQGELYLFSLGMRVRAVALREQRGPQGDRWVAGEALEPGAEAPPALGFAPRYRKAGTHPVYLCEAPGGDRFLALDAAGDGRRVLGEGPHLWLYDAPGPARVPIHTARDGAGGERRAVAGDPPPRSRLLGYAARSLEAPALAGCNRWQLCLWRSRDGERWERVRGEAPGGALLGPRSPGAREGLSLPAVFERQEILEVYFHDDSPAEGGGPALPRPWRLRLPLAALRVGAAYWRAARQADAWYGDDICWSPFNRRYFALTLERPLPAGSRTGPTAPLVRWSDRDPDPKRPPSFPSENRLSFELPTTHPGDPRERWAGRGGFMRRGPGHSPDYVEPPEDPRHTVLHMFYPACPPQAEPSELDIDQATVFIFHGPG